MKKTFILYMLAVLIGFFSSISASEDHESEIDTTDEVDIVDEIEVDEIEIVSDNKDIEESNVTKEVSTSSNFWRYIIVNTIFPNIFCLLLFLHEDIKNDIKEEKKIIFAKNVLILFAGSFIASLLYAYLKENNMLESYYLSYIITSLINVVFLFMTLVYADEKGSSYNIFKEDTILNASFTAMLALRVSIQVAINYKDLVGFQHQTSFE